MSQPAGVGSATNQDLVSKIRVVPSILAQVISGNGTTTTGTAVDLQGYESATFLIEIGNSADVLSGSLYHSFSFTECDTSGGSYTAVAAANLIDDPAASVLASGAIVVDAPAEDSRIFQVGYTGGKRYVKIIDTLTGNHATGTPVAASVIKGHARVNPATM